MGILGLLGFLTRRLEAAIHGLVGDGHAGRADINARAGEVLQLSADAVIGKTVAGVITSWNKGAERLYGYDAAEVLGRSITMLVPVDRVDEMPHIFARLARGESQERFETTRARKDGRLVDVSLTVVPIIDKSGKIVGAWSVAHDITDRKQADTRFRALLDAAPDAMVVVDAPGRIMLVNAQAETLFGYSREELIGRAVEQLVPEPLRKQHVAHRSSFHERPNVRPMGAGLELRGRRKDGSEFPIEISLSPIFTDTGRLVTAAIRDITDRKQAEEERRQAKEAAEAANRAKSEFLAVVSHEIRTPMNGIIGMTALALDAELPRAVRDHLEMVRTSADTLLSVINGILDFSKIEAGKVDLDEVGFDVRETIGDTLKMLSNGAHEKGLDLTLEIDPDVPNILVGDRGRLRQVVVNLVGNAIKFSEGGRIIARIGAEERSDIAVTVHLRVSDTGIGIPPEKLDTIFNAFEQADVSTTRRYGGTGLGLAICTQLAHLMGGHMWAESVVGRGSTFHFTARLTVGQTAATLGASGLRDEPVLVVDDHATNRGIPRPEPPRARPLRVLLAEDNYINQKLAAALLEDAGHQVSLATNGREAAEAAARGAFDVVLMDVQMPEMDGFEATVAIRAAERATGRHLPIVAMTASAMKGDRERCLAAGMDGYVAKPIDATELCATLEQATAPAPPAEAAAPPVALVFDVDAALRRVRGDAELLRKLARRFLATASERLANIRRAAARRDGAGLHAAAHSLKGTAGIFGGTTVCEIAERLETMGREDRFAGIDESGEQLARDLGQFTRALEGFCGSQPPVTPTGRFTTDISERERGGGAGGREE